MLMGVKDFLAPTRGRIILFVILFILILLYDTVFAPFPGSPAVDNISSPSGAFVFIAYILIIPYVLSAIVPAFYGLKKKTYIRNTNLAEFLPNRPARFETKPTRQERFTFPEGTPVEESTLSPNQPDQVQPGDKKGTQPEPKTADQFIQLATRPSEPKQGQKVKTSAKKTPVKKPSPKKEPESNQKKSSKKKTKPSPKQVKKPSSKPNPQKKNNPKPSKKPKPKKK